MVINSLSLASFVSGYYVIGIIALRSSIRTSVPLVNLFDPLQILTVSTGD